MGLHEVRSPRCSFCDSSKMSEIMDFGKVALAGGFLKRSQLDDEETHPLRLYFCHQCFAVQVVDKVSEDLLFGSHRRNSTQKPADNPAHRDDRELSPGESRSATPAYKTRTSPFGGR